MTDPIFNYADLSTEQLVEDWAGEKGFNAANQICLHLEERFHVNTIELVAALNQGEFLILRIATDQWKEPREFGLLSDGSLAW